MRHVCFRGLILPCMVVSVFHDGNPCLFHRFNMMLLPVASGYPGEQKVAGSLFHPFHATIAM